MHELTDQSIDREGTLREDEFLSCLEYFVLGTEFDADVTKYIEFNFLYTVNLGIPDIAKTTHHAETVLSFDIWGPLDFDVSLLFDRQEPFVSRH